MLTHQMTHARSERQIPRDVRKQGRRASRWHSLHRTDIGDKSQGSREDLRQRVGAGAVAQRVQLPPAEPASHVAPVQVPAAPLLIQLPAYGLGTAEEDDPEPT